MSWLGYETEDIKVDNTMFGDMIWKKSDEQLDFKWIEKTG